MEEWCRSHLCLEETSLKVFFNAVRRAPLAAQTVVGLLASPDATAREQAVGCILRILESFEAGLDFGRALLGNGFWQAMHRRSLSVFHQFERYGLLSSLTEHLMVVQ